MLIKVYKNRLPEDALYIRTEVFVREQGFQDEFDLIDESCIHIIGYEDDAPIAVCRCFYEHDPKVWHIGRVAVMKEYRGRGIGTLIMQEAENAILQSGGIAAELSSQCRAKHFYETLGYAETGDEYLDEGCPHILMKKDLI